MATRIKLAALVAVPLVLIGGALAYAHQGGAHHAPPDAKHTEMHLDHMAKMLGKIGASDAQKTQIDGMLRVAFADTKAVKDSHHAAFGEFHQLLFAPSVVVPALI